MIRERTWHQDAMSGCVQNTLQWFSLDLQFCESSSFRCLGAGLGLHFGRLLATMGSLLLVFEGTGKEVGFFLIFDDFRGCTNPEFSEGRGEITRFETPILQLQIADFGL